MDSATTLEFPIRLSGRDTPSGTELFAVTDRYQLLRYQEGDLRWEVTPAPGPVEQTFTGTTLAVTPGGRVMVAWVSFPGVAFYEPSTQWTTLRDPDPRNSRGADFVIGDGDGFFVGFPSSDGFLMPSELYHFQDRAWQPRGLFPASNNPLLTGIKLDQDSLLVAMTSGNFTLFPTAPDCALKRVSDNGPDNLRLASPLEMVFVERVIRADTVAVYWQPFTRTP